MKTKPRIHQSTLAFRLSATVLCLLTSVLWTPAQAQNLVVSNSAVTRSGTHYENNGTGNAALTISGSLGSFTGTNIILTATAASGNGGIGANLTTQGSLNLADSTINSALYGILLAGTSSATLNNTNITTTLASAHGINLATSSTVTMIGGTITTGSTSARGVTAGGASYVTLQDTVINSYGDGINLSGTSVLAPSRANITVQNGVGLNMATSSTATITGGTITTVLGGIGVTLNSASVVGLRNTTINSFAEGVLLTATSSAALNNVNIATRNTSAHGINLATSSTVTMIGGTITTGTTSARGVTASGASYVALQDTVINSYGDGINLSGTSVLAPSRANITVQNGAGLNLATSSTATITGGTLTTILSGNGVQAATASYINLQDMVINSTGMGVYLSGSSSGALYDIHVVSTNASGVQAVTSSRLNATNLTIDVSGSAPYGLVISGSDNTAATVDGLNVIKTGGINNANAQAGVASRNGASLTLTNANIVVDDGGASSGLNVQGAGATLSATNVRVRVSGTQSSGLWVADNSASMTVTNIDVMVDGENARAIYMASAYTAIPDAPTHTLEINSGTLTAAQGSGLAIYPQTQENYNVDSIANYHGYFAVVLRDTKLSGTSALEITSIRSGTHVDGSQGVANMPTTFSLTTERSTLTGDANFKGSAVSTITFTDSSTLAGNITASDSTVTTVNLDNSTFTGKTTVSGSAVLDLNLYESGTWYMVGDSTLTNLTAAKTARVNFPVPTAGTYHKLTVNNNLGGEGGTFAMHTDIAAGKADLISVSGTASTGAHRISLTNANDNAVTGTESPLLLVETAGGSATFTGTLTAGVYDYSVQNGSQVGDAFALPETNWYLYRAGLSNVGNAIINTSAMLGYDWFYSLDALYLRMGDVRQEMLAGRANPPGEPRLGEDASPYQNRAPAGNLWVRARGYRLNADASLSGRPFNEYAYGLTAGADKAFHRNTGTTLVGGFLDAGRIDRDFSGANNIGNSDNTGYTNSISAGLYATYLRQNGWHADLVLKADRYKHHFDTTTADRLPVTGDYSNNALGASLEIGRRLQRADGYWVEPMVQAAYTWLQSANYRTGPGNAALGVIVDSTRAAQYRALVRFGRRIANSRWLPYGKFGVVRTDFNGGALHIADGANTLFVPDCDGWRVEFGAGTSYRINWRSQIYFDYEYDRAPHYERPWALNLGYRYGW